MYIFGGNAKFDGRRWQYVKCRRLVFLEPFRCIKTIDKEWFSTTILTVIIEFAGLQAVEELQA